MKQFNAKPIFVGHLNQNVNCYDKLFDLKIGFTNYELYVSDWVEIEDKKDYRGKVEFQECKITILRGMNEQRTKEVIVHEIVHALINESSTENLLEDKEEEFVERFSKVLNQFLIDNTNFHERMMGEVL